MTDLLTVVVPTHNGAATLADALDSLQRQGDALAEVIVVDDGSLDDSAEIADRHPGRPRVLRLGRNRGVAFARNTGLIEARTDRVAFLDQDDMWLPGRAGRLLVALDGEPDCAALVTTEQAFALTEDRAELERAGHPFLPWVRHWVPRADVTGLLDSLPAVPPDPAPTVMSVPQVLAGSITLTTSYVLSRRLALQLGGFATWLRAADDWTLLQMLAAHTRLMRFDEPSVLYRVHVANTSSRTDWSMKLLLAAAAVRFGGVAVPPGQERDPAAVWRLADSPFLLHFLDQRGRAHGLRPGLDAAALAQVLSTDGVDRRRTAAYLLRRRLADRTARWRRAR